MEGYLALGIVLLQMGELIQAKAHLEQGLAFYDSQQHHTHTSLYGQDPKITYLSAESHTLWLLGYPEQARQRNQEALTLSRKLVHPPSLAFALSFATWVDHCCKDWSAVRTRAEELRTLATEQEFLLWSAQGSLWQGWLLSEQGQQEKGLAQISQTLPAWQATGAELGLPFYLSVLAKAHGKVGQVAEGVSVLTEAFTRVDRTGERYWEAELYRLKGELLLKSKVKTSSELKQVKTG